MFNIRINRCYQVLIFLCWVAASVCYDSRSSNETTDATTERCHSSYFECKTGFCIKGNLRCNHVDDCPDRSDEIDCDVKLAQTSCSGEEYLCTNPPMCISIDDLCNDFNQCWDVDATDLCPITCQPHKFKCLNVSQCVDKKYLCDGSKDCMDGSDELNCDDESYKCEEEDDSFLCDDKSLCIFASDVCDGHELCDDGSDEKNDCYKLCEARKCGKNQLCLPEGQGVKCVCKDGYQFDNDKNCVEHSHCNVSDIDRPCSQTCIDGRYGMGPQCRCIFGYSLDKDGKSCNAIGSSDAILYVATTSEIHQWSFKNQNYTTLINGLKGLKGLAVDHQGKRIFWSQHGDVDSRPEVLSIEIARGEKTIKVIASFGLQKPEGVAYDFITKNLYIVDSGIPAILTCDPSQLYCVTVFNSSMINFPKEIVLNPAKGLLYYTELGIEPAIMKGSMDGTNSDTLVSANMHHPTSLQLDLTTNRLYWIDSFYSFGHVFRVDLDGTNKKDVLIHKISSPMLLTIFEDSLYWFNDVTKSVMVANKFTGDNAKIIFHYDHQPTAMMIDHKSLQNDHVLTRCHKKRCHLCLLNDKESGSCFCSRGYQVAHTKQYCERVEEPSFLLMSDTTQILMFPMHKEIRQPTANYIKTPHMRNVNKLSYLPKSHGILYSSLNTDGVVGEASIEMIPGMDSSTLRSVKVVGVNSVVNVAADEASSTVFWTDYKRRSIRIATLDGAFNTTLPITATQPTALCVDSAEGTLYFSDIQNSRIGGPVIKKCSMDGQSCSNLVSDRIQFPNHLVAQGQQLYWSDYDLGEISTINQWGNDRATLAIADGNPMSFAIDSGILYWIEDGKNSIFYKHINQEGMFEGSFETGADNPQDLIAVVPHILPQTACTHMNGGCEQICISIARSMEVSCLCSDGFHLHQDKKQCVRNNNQCNSQVCNGKLDCPEDGCQKAVTCSEDEFQCDNGRCIIVNFKCDGDDDCKDGSDENPDHCSNECNPEGHVCDGFKCITKLNICDGFMDCQDESDEADCKLECDDDEMSCGNSECISEDWVCDGMEDCDDGRDEIECNETCQDDEFTCNDGECIDESYKCNGFENCIGGEDEERCPPPTVHMCRESEYRCTDGECIHESARCDGNPDCIGNEDEKGCNDLCHENEFQCETRECISYNLVCNLKNDCQDGSDEVNFCIGTTTARPIVTRCGGFTCGSGHCIDADKQCDGETDCLDNTDEVNCDKSCKNINCSQICVDDLSGVRCECEQGYSLKDDGLACDDIDECKSQNGGCSQKCINMKGHHSSSKGLGFKCQCFEGFEHSQDYYSCKVKGKRPDLFVSTSSGIKKISMEGQHKHGSVIASTKRAFVYKTEVDSRRGSVYWVSQNPGETTTLSRLDNDHEQPQIIFRGLIFDFALDWITGNIYIDHFTIVPVISVVKSLSNNSTVLTHDIFKGDGTPHTLVLHPPKGQMFYVMEYRSHTAFHRSSMDGKRQVDMPLASRYANRVISFLNVDTIADRLYWLHPVFGMLMSVTIDDKDLWTYDLHTNTHKLKSMDIFEGVAYFVRNNSILSYSLHKGAKQAFTTVARIHNPQNIRVHHHLKQPMAPNPCERKECMYMCLLADNGGASCVCPNGLTTNYYHSCEGPKVHLNEILRQFSKNTTTIPSIIVQPSQKQRTDKPQHQTHSSNSVFKCTLLCLNGGSCVSDQSFQFCRCFDEFEGGRCERRKEQQKKIGKEEEDGFAWVAGLVIGLALLVLMVMFALWYFKYKRHNRSLINSITFKKQNKFVICNQEDNEGLVPEISFGNPGFQEEIDEEAQMHEDHQMNKDNDWWKKLLSRSRRSVDSAFHSKNSVADDGMDRYMKGDPQDPVMSDKVKLLK